MADFNYLEQCTSSALGGDDVDASGTGLVASGLTHRQRSTTDHESFTAVRVAVLPVTELEQATMNFGSARVEPNAQPVVADHNYTHNYTQLQPTRWGPVRRSVRL